MTVARDILRRARRYLRAVRGRDLFPRVDERVPTERHGSDYGGWHIVPEVVAGAVVYSVGVGEDVSFDLSLIKSHGVHVYAFDPTPRSIRWVAAQTLPPSFHFFPIGVSDRDGPVAFYPPENREYVSHSTVFRRTTADRAIVVDMRRLASIMAEHGHTHIGILKMDMEGHEYAVIDDMLRSGIRPAQLLVEFHHALGLASVGQTAATIRSLRQAGYRIVFNSASGAEYSFVFRGTR